MDIGLQTGKFAIGQRKAPSGMKYDRCNFPTILEKALLAADWDGFAARRNDSRARGKVRGRGIGQYLEVTGGPVPEMGGFRFAADRPVTIITGTPYSGQGHASPFHTGHARRPLGVRHLNIPDMPLRIWDAIQRACEPAELIEATAPP